MRKWCGGWGTRAHGIRGYGREEEQRGSRGWHFSAAVSAAASLLRAPGTCRGAQCPPLQSQQPLLPSPTCHCSRLLFLEPFPPSDECFPRRPPLRRLTGLPHLFAVGMLLYLVVSTLTVSREDVRPKMNIQGQEVK